MAILFPERRDRNTEFWRPGYRLVFRAALKPGKPMFVAAKKRPFQPVMSHMTAVILFDMVSGWWITPSSLGERGWN